MAYVKEHPPSEVYHLTKKENLNSILEDGMIRRFSDTECWFCVDLQKMKAYMEQTVMCEGKPYYDVTGQLCRYPKFVPEDYVLLKLIPCRQEDNWYRWEQEIPAGSPAALVRAAHEFGYLKSDVGFFCFRVFEKGGCSKVLCGVFSFRAVRGKAVAVKFYVGFPIRSDLCRKRHRHLTEDADAFLLECSGNQLNNSSSFCWSVPSLAYGSASNCRKLCLMSFVSSLKPRMYESAM